MPHFQPKDIVAILVVIGFFAAKFGNVNGALDPALFLILGYYFVKRQNGADNGK